MKECSEIETATGRALKICIAFVIGMVFSSLLWVARSGVIPASGLLGYYTSRQTVEYMYEVD